jgi:hypothetical protein
VVVVEVDAALVDETAVEVDAAGLAEELVTAVLEVAKVLVVALV